MSPRHVFSSCLRPLYEWRQHFQNLKDATNLYYTNMFWRQLHFSAFNKGCLLCVLQWLWFKRNLYLRCVIKKIGFRSCVWPTCIIGTNSIPNVQLFTNLATLKLSYYNFEYTDSIQVTSSCCIDVQKPTYKSNLQKNKKWNKLATIETIMKIQLPRLIAIWHSLLLASVNRQTLRSVK
jgi:hypothetical protein